MEIVAQKMRKGLTLDVDDLEVWVEYNYLVLNDRDKEIIDNFIKRKRRIRTGESALFPIVGFAIYGINKHVIQLRSPMNWTIVLASMWGLHNLTNFGINKDKETEYRKIFDTYKNDVLDEKFRGLKLFGGKHVNKVVEKEFTTSNLDELKSMLAK